MELPFSPGPPVIHHSHHLLGGVGQILNSESKMQSHHRCRANTWPLPNPENSNECDDVGLIRQTQQIVDDVMKSEGPMPTKKNSSRRNAWGNMSYADLITQAIQSSPDYRLTLSQIYDWMVQNIPYFKDKGDSNSSAGWKNSIRHNLSLHSRFVRVQNESTGKSSWWMINPDAKPGKCARRRATSMETSKYEKKRGRIRKKVECLNNGLETTTASSPVSSEGIDSVYPDSPFNSAYQLSPNEYRQPASSNASSSSCLSPVHSVKPEADPVSPLTWQYGTSNTGLKYGQSDRIILPKYGAERLTDSNAQEVMHMETSYYSDKSHSSSGNGYLNSDYGSAVFVNQQSAIMTQPRTDSPSYQVGSIPQRVAGITNTYERSTFSPSTRESSLLAHLTVPTYSPSFACTMNNSMSSPHEQNSGMLRAVLSHKDDEDMIQSIQHNYSSGISQHAAASISSIPTLPTDIDFSLENFAGGLDCNVEEVIRHELNMEGNFDTLDLFTPSSSGTATVGNQEASSSAHLGSVTQTSSHSWVR